MNKRLNKKRVRREDRMRVLVTETSPYETPIIFSNDRFYMNLRRADKLSRLTQLLQSKLVTNNSADWKTPYHYKIRKNSDQHRRLALLHPQSQWAIANFYSQHDDQILNACSKSSFSIRAPERIASTFYIPAPSTINNALRAKTISSLANDRDTTFSTSYFAYRGYARIYQFFESPHFSSLEKQFSQMRMLDMSRCFDSIYTHTIVWALTGKETAKKNIRRTSFGNRFDKLLRHANQGETNGIPIGPEISRIFAEIILQRVDADVLQELKSNDCLEDGCHFAIRRYVDDIIIFTNDIQAAQRIQDRYTDALRCYNLNLNDQKAKHFSRPFATQKSRVVRECSLQSNAFTKKFLDREIDGRLKLKRIRNPQQLSESLIRTVRSLCLGEGVAYEEVSSFLISILHRNIGEVVEGFRGETTHDLTCCRDALIVLLEVIFFLYAVSPSVSASYKVATSMIKVSRFAASVMCEYAGSIKTHIAHLAEDLIKKTCLSMQRLIGNHVPLEVINVLLASRELGDNYELQDIAANLIFGPMVKGEIRWSYFDIISCLYYIQDRPAHRHIRESIENYISIELQSLKTTTRDSEKAHLLLDSLTCPYLDRKKRKEWTNSVCRWDSNNAPDQSEVDDFLDSKEYWFVSWENFDILNALKKKELRPSY